MIKVIAALIVIVCILLPATAAAHVLEKDGTIGAVLHINPGDDPVAGEQSSFYFDFEDTSGRFSTENCSCHLVIEQDNTAIYDELFSQSSGGTYTFPARGLYSVKAVGKPLAGDSFQPFTLSYDVRVERGDGTAASSSSSQRLPIIISATLAILFAFYVIRAKIVHKVK